MYALKYFSQFSDCTIYLMHLKLFKYRDAHKLRLDRNNQKFNYSTLREENTEAEITDGQRKNANSKLLETWRLRNEAGFHRHKTISSIPSTVFFDILKIPQECLLVPSFVCFWFLFLFSP